MNKTIKTNCVYCEEEKPCVKWKQTDEMVCYDCRLEQLDNEFYEPFVKTDFDYDNRLF